MNKVYELGWRVAAGLCVTTGIVCAVLSFKISQELALAFLGAMSACVARMLRQSYLGRSLRINEQLVVAMAFGAAALVAEAGLLSVSGTAGVTLALVLAAASPPVVRLLHKPLRSGDAAPDWSPVTQLPPPPGPVETPETAAAAESVVRRMTTRQIIRAWRASYLDLIHAGTAAARARVVATRQRYVDELESRDPLGVRRWLDSGARAASDPTRFLDPKALPADDHDQPDDEDRPDAAAAS